MSILANLGHFLAFLAIFFAKYTKMACFCDISVSVAGQNDTIDYGRCLKAVWTQVDELVSDIESPKSILSRFLVDFSRFPLRKVLLSRIRFTAYERLDVEGQNPCHSFQNKKTHLWHPVPMF